VHHSIINVRKIHYMKNKSDSEGDSDVVIFTRLGIGPKYYDTRRYTNIVNLLQTVIMA
jgi:hypothetical protein